ncbi:MAG TPA: helix-turn-helix domain-containing protein [Candidatus Limihabitans stercoravium]|nr:helix-turn-helix domain-containing protein [Candidatus Limihabitans stercoravium]
MQFSERLKKLRKQKGVSQTQLANAIYVSRSAVAKWENGLGLPSEQSLAAIADYFGIEYEILLSDTQKETAVSNKDHSKPGKWITTLSICLGFVVIFAIILIVTLNNSPDEPTVTPIISHELVFETEKDLPTENFVNYTDSEINTDKEFADSRTFEIADGEAGVTLPALLVKTKSNDTISYNEVIYDKIDITFSQDSIFGRVETGTDGRQHVNVYPNDYYAVQFQGWVNIRYENLTLSLKVYRNYIAVESIELSLADKSTAIFIGESQRLNLSVYPEDASYKDSEVTISGIRKPDGQFYQDDLSQYAYLNGRSLFVTLKIQIGSTIFLSATSTHDNVASNELAVDVARVPVETISISCNPVRSDGTIIKGESTEVSLSVQPSNATFNLLNESADLELLTPDLATLTKHDDGWTLTASESKQAIGQTIRVSVTIEGITTTREWVICGVRPRSIVILNSATNSELEKNTYVDKGDTLQLQAVVLPENADFETVSYNLFADVSGFGRFVSVSEDGTLVISEDAPSGMVIYLSATISLDIGGVSSEGYTLIVN